VWTPLRLHGPARRTAQTWGDPSLAVGSELGVGRNGADLAKASLPDLVEGHVQLSDEAGVRNLLARELDFGCRPTIIRQSDGRLLVPVIGSRDELEALSREGFDVQLIERTPSRRRDIGRGDRFEGGETVPRGYATKVQDDEEGSKA
jgi:hypothetical protein